jgi:hypothetical protein
MKKIKMVLSVMFSTILIVTSALMVFAQDSETVISEETVHAEESHTQEEASLFVAKCPYCDGYPVPVCVGDKVCTESGYNCIFNNDCYVFRYQSKMYLRCSACPNLHEDRGYHDCAEGHLGCGIGTVKLCTY